MDTQNQKSVHREIKGSSNLFNKSKKNSKKKKDTSKKAKSKDMNEKNKQEGQMFPL